MWRENTIEFTQLEGKILTIFLSTTLEPIWHLIEVDVLPPFIVTILIPPTGNNYSGALQLLDCELLIQPLASLPASLVMPMSPSSQVTNFFFANQNWSNPFRLFWDWLRGFSYYFGWKWNLVFPCVMVHHHVRHWQGATLFPENLFSPQSCPWTQPEVRLLWRYSDIRFPHMDVT